MVVDVMKVRFSIRKIGEQFAIVIKYGDKTFTFAKGALPYVKAKYLQIVRNRELLRPVIEKALQM